MVRNMKELEWFGCYNGSWQGDIVPEAFAHPAKFSRNLIRRIYQHLLTENLLHEGDTVLDCFAGVGLGALDAMLNGLHYTGIELEPRFHALAQQNITLWNSRYADKMPRWGSAKVYCGDSRKLVSVLQDAGAIVASPPYSECRIGGMDSMRRTNDSIGDYGKTDGQLGAMPEGDYTAVIGSPPYSSSIEGRGDGIDWEKIKDGGTNRTVGRASIADGYGKTDGQLGSMPQGDYNAIISSPAYGDTIKGGEGPGARHDFKTHSPETATHNSSQAAYGDTAENLGNMPVVDGVVGSPPFEGCHSIVPVEANSRQVTAERVTHKIRYGMNDGQLGNDTGNTFWTAARTIVEQTYTVLKPGGVAAWVTGNFKRNGKIVDFGQQWLELCQAVGFEPLQHIIAWKTEYKGTQVDIFGNHHKKQVDRVSFFRRLSNAKDPDKAILSEEVWIVGKL